MQQSLTSSPESKMFRIFDVMGAAEPTITRCPSSAVSSAIKNGHLLHHATHSCLRVSFGHFSFSACFYLLYARPIFRPRYIRFRLFYCVVGRLLPLCCCCSFSFFFYLRRCHLRRTSGGRIRLLLANVGVSRVCFISLGKMFRPTRPSRPPSLEDWPTLIPHTHTVLFKRSRKGKEE